MVWIAFVALTFLVMSTDYLPGDLAVTRWVQSISWGPLATLFPSISAMSGIGQIGFAAVIVVLVFFVNRPAVPFALIAVLGDLLYWLLNIVLQKPRPAGVVIRVTEHPGSYAYPSGHAALAVTATVVLLLCVVFPLMGRGWTIIGTIAGLAVILTVGIERVYVGVHYPSDILGGFLVAAAWLTLALSVRRIGDPVFDALSRRGPRRTP